MCACECLCITSVTFNQAVNWFDTIRSTTHFSRHVVRLHAMLAYWIYLNSFNVLKKCVVSHIKPRYDLARQTTDFETINGPRSFGLNPLLSFRIPWRNQRRNVLAPPHASRTTHNKEVRHSVSLVTCNQDVTWFYIRLPDV